MRLCTLSAALLFGTLAACVPTAGPSSSPVPAAHAAAATHVRDELYFGLRKPDAALVSEAEWQAFVDSVVTPRFPEGLTVLAGYGQYQPEGRPLVREPARVLILVHGGGPGVERHIRQVAAIYCRRFQQDSVMRVTAPVSVEFLDARADALRAAGAGAASSHPDPAAVRAAPPPR